MQASVFSGRGVCPCVAPARSCKLAPRAFSFSQEGTASRPLPNATWLLSYVQDQFYNLRGEDFVIRRGEESEAASRPRSKKHSRMLSTIPPQDKHAEMVHKAVWNAPPMMLMLEGGVVDVDVDVELDGHMEPCPPESAAAASNTCTGIVSVNPLPGMEVQPEPEHVDKDGIYTSSSSSPRRTKVVGFTCLKCGARNHKAVNPKSYLQGTLVCQCGKCSRKHIVTDHLKLFSINKLDGMLRTESGGTEVKLSEDDIPASLRYVDMSVLDDDDTHGKGQ